MHFLRLSRWFSLGEIFQTKTLLTVAKNLYLQNIFLSLEKPSIVLIIYFNLRYQANNVAPARHYY